MTAPRPLEAAAVEQLSRELLAAVHAHYLRRPTSRSTAQEVLNALAIIVATIFTAAHEAGDEYGAREFFDSALDLRMQTGAPTTLGSLERWTRP